MSEDLIERLSELSEEMSFELGSYNPDATMLREAAAEIERLRAKLASAKEVIAPFATACRCCTAGCDRDDRIVNAVVTVGHLRAAAEWMEKGDE